MFLILSSYNALISCFSSCERKRSFVHQVDHFAQVVSALKRFFNSLKISPILYSMVFGAGGALLEAFQIREQLAVDVVDQVIAGQRRVVVDLPSAFFGAAQLTSGAACR